MLLTRALTLIPLVAENWAPPIDGRLYLGLSDPAGMLRANAAQLAAQDNDCPTCVAALQTCMRYPDGKDCPEGVAQCTAKTCNSSSVVQQTHAASLIGKTPTYFAPGTPAAQCSRK